MAYTVPMEYPRVSTFSYCQSLTLAQYKIY